MNILLTAINAKYIHSNPAVYSLKSCAGEYAEHVDIIEFTINQPPFYKKSIKDIPTFSLFPVISGTEA